MLCDLKKVCERLSGSEDICDTNIQTILLSISMQELMFVQYFECPVKQR